MLYIAYNLLFITILLLVFGSILGQAGTVTMMIGIALAAFIIQYSGLIKGTTLENSRVYNESIDLNNF